MNEQKPATPKEMIGIGLGAGALGFAISGTRKLLRHSKGGSKS